MSRDRFGIKPLYYYRDKNNFIFSSEIKAIIEHDEVITAPNIRYCKDYLANGPKEYIKETSFENIYRFNNASFLELSINDLHHDEMTQTIFWHCKPNPSSEKFNPRKAEEYANQYYELLCENY